MAKDKQKPPVIELKDFTVYVEDLLLLHNINLTLRPGQLVYITGDPGTGKSSFLKTLIGEIPLRKGSGMVAGFKLGTPQLNPEPKGGVSIATTFLRRKIGIIMQDFQLPTNMTSLEVLRLVLVATGWRDPKLMEEKIADSLVKVGMPGKLRFRFHELTSAEQRKLCIAMALLNTPQLVLADDCTWNLSTDDTKIIMEVLLSLQKDYGTAIVFATNDIVLTHQYPADTYRIENKSFHKVFITS